MTTDLTCELFSMKLLRVQAGGATIYEAMWRAIVAASAKEQK